MEIYNLLNFFRWFSAFLVVAGHLRSILFIDYHQWDGVGNSVLVKIFYFITGFGHQGVITFFVVSGYLVGGKMLQKYMLYNNGINTNYLKSYFIRRFSRIYTVLIPALCVGVILDFIGINLFADSYVRLSLNVSENTSFFIFTNNVLNLQTIFSPALGTNTPLWSLANEWWYYMLLPLLLINTASRLLFCFLVITISYFNMSLLLYFSLWLLGAGAFQIKHKILNIRVSALLLVISLMVSRKIIGVYIDFAIYI